MKTKLILPLLAAACLCGQAAFADDGTIRVAAAVDVTDAGRGFAIPSPSHPIYYAPVVSGYKERGAILTYYQRGLPPTFEVTNQLDHVFAAQGYRLAPAASAASIILDFQWGYVAPYIAPRRGHFGGFAGMTPRTGPGRGRHLSAWVTNWDEMGTYIIGDRWPDLAIEARRGEADPGTQEVFDSIQNAVNDPTGGSLGEGARYYLLVTALDGPAYLRHQPVMLWRAHVSTPYWGHYIDEVLPTLIDTAALVGGHVTPRIEVFTIPIAGWQSLSNGTQQLSLNRAAPLPLGERFALAAPAK